MITSSPNRLRLLVTSAGRRVELVNAFRCAADELGVRIEILACDLKPDLSAACRSADRAFAVPPANSDIYVDSVLDIVRAHDVDLLVPTIDPELLPLAKARATFAAAGCCVAISGAELVAMAGDKLATAQFLAAHAIPSPTTVTIETALAAPEWWSRPMFVKPRFGSAGRNTSAIAGAAALAAVETPEPMLVQTLLEGDEYTINVFFDRAGSLVTAVPHRRLAVRAGEVEKGVTERVPELIDLARQLAEALPDPRGALCFQAMRDSTGAAVVFEINARFGGGYPLAHRAGAPFARWLIEERLGMPTSGCDDWRDGVSMLRYDAAVFVAA